MTYHFYQYVKYLWFQVYRHLHRFLMIKIQKKIKVRGMKGIEFFVILKYFYHYLELDLFLVERYLVIFLFFFFFGMRSSGVTLALVSPVGPESIDRSVRSLSTTINCGDGASD